MRLLTSSCHSSYMARQCFFGTGLDRTPGVFFDLALHLPSGRRMLRTLRGTFLGITPNQSFFSSERMQTLLLLSLMPLVAFGSTVYTFSEPVANRGTVGFTYTAPDYLTTATN